VQHCQTEGSKGTQRLHQEVRVQGGKFSAGSPETAPLPRRPCKNRLQGGDLARPVGWDKKEVLLCGLVGVSGGEGPTRILRRVGPPPRRESRTSSWGERSYQLRQNPAQKKKKSHHQGDAGGKNLGREETRNQLRGGNQGEKNCTWPFQKKQPTNHPPRGENEKGGHPPKRAPRKRRKRLEKKKGGAP